jgi:hypothetical protein
VNVLLQFGDDFLQAVLLVLTVLLLLFWFIRYEIDNQEMTVARWLTLAEREFNALYNSGQSHGGRRERIGERKEWNEMNNIPNTGIHIHKYKKGYKSLAHELAELNERDATGKNTTQSRAGNIAFLLRFLYEGDVKAAQAKIFADARNEGKLPYVAPGIYELVGFDQFDLQKGFPPGAGVERWLLKRVVRTYRFPREIRMINTVTKEFRDPHDALAQLFQQNP